MINAGQFLNQSAKVAALRRDCVKSQIALRKAERALEQHEFELLSATPVQGKNDAERKLDRERILRTAQTWRTLDEAAFKAKATLWEAEAALEAEKDLLKGIEWAARCEILRGLPENANGTDEYMDDRRFNPDLPSPPPPPSMVGFGEEMLDRFFGEE